MLNINNLHVSINGKSILKDINLSINPGEVHVIMGPNGSGKSTLAQVIAGKSDYSVDQGDILLDNKSILPDNIEQRSLNGIFLSFQYPMEIPGINNTYFLKAAVNTHRKHLGLEEYDAFDFLKIVKEKMAELEIDKSFLERSLNEGFSGGEKKRNEILQMSLLQPKIAILDEIDSGLDIDALKTVSKGVTSLRDNKRSFLLITHYNRILQYISPDHVHVLKNGTIVKSGTQDLAIELEKDGYQFLQKDA